MKIPVDTTDTICSKELTFLARKKFYRHLDRLCFKLIGVLTQSNICVYLESCFWLPDGYKFNNFSLFKSGLISNNSWQKYLGLACFALDVWLSSPSLLWNAIQLCANQVCCTVRVKNQSTHKILLCNDHKEVQLQVKQGTWTCRQGVSESERMMHTAFKEQMFVVLFCTFSTMNVCTSSVPSVKVQCFWPSVLWKVGS